MDSFSGNVSRSGFGGSPEVEMHAVGKFDCELVGIEDNAADTWRRTNLCRIDGSLIEECTVISVVTEGNE